MLVDSALIRANPTAARLYYAVRTLDRGGCGFVRVPLSKLAKRTGLAVCTVRRLLGRSVAAGWLQVVEYSGKDVFVKYRSERCLVAQQPKGWHCRHYQRVRNLQDSYVLMGYAILAVQLREQRLHEAKLLYSMRKGKRPPKQLINSKYVQAVRARKLPPSAGSCPNPATFAGRYLDAVHVQDQGGAYSTGISQRRVAQILGLTQPTVSFYLKQFAHLRVQCFDTPTVTDVIEGNYFVFNNKEAKRLTYVYQDVCSHRHWRQLRMQRLLPLLLTETELTIAKLMGVWKGYGHSVTGAIRYISSIGLARFRRNNRLLQNDHRPSFYLFPKTNKQVHSL